MKAGRIGPRLMVGEQLYGRSMDNGHLLRNRQLAVEINAPGRFGRRLADAFVDNKFSPLLGVKDYHVKLFTPKGIELESALFIGKTAEEIDNLAGRIDAASQVRPVRSLAEEIGIKMIDITAGKFIFQKHEGVNNNGYRIAETPFTNGHFRALFEKEPDGLKEIIKDPMELLLASLKLSAEENTDKREESPLVNISQIKSTAIANLIGMRLPTELEWERAAAYTEGRRYPWGNTFDETRVTFNDKGTRSVYAHPEGASHEGALDLAGNVWEWTSTLYGKIDFTDPNNPIFPERGNSFSIRGGSWNDRSRDYLAGSSRGGDNPEDWDDNCGLRLAEDLK